MTFVAVVAVALLGWLGYKLWPTNEKVIQSRVNDLAEELSLPAGEGLMKRTARAYSISQFFSSDVSVDLNGVYMERPVRTRFGAIEGRDNLKLAVSQALEQSLRLEVSFVDVLVEMGADERTASVFASALIQRQEKVGRQRETTGAQELKFEVQRNGRVWEITRVVTYKTMQ